MPPIVSTTRTPKKQVSWSDASRGQKAAGIAIGVILAGLIGMGIFVAAVAPSKPTPDGAIQNIGTRVEVSTSFVGCQDAKNLDRMITLYHEKDLVAFATFGMNNGCENFAEGEEGLVEDTSVFHNAMCVRKPGEPDCLWFPAPLTKAMKSQSAS